MYQIRTEQIEFVIQSDKLTDQVVLHLAVHVVIVPTVAVSRLAVYNVDARLQVAYGTCAIALGFCRLLFASGTPTRRTISAKRGSLRRASSRGSTPTKAIQRDRCLRPSSSEAKALSVSPRAAYTVAMLLPHTNRFCAIARSFLRTLRPSSLFPDSA